MQAVSIDRFTTPTESPYQTRCPRRTIWGTVQDSYKVPDMPVWFVSTAGHGGYVVDRQWAIDWLSTPAQEIESRGYGSQGMGSFLYFEEDCLWAVLEYESPEVQLWAFNNLRPREVYPTIQEYAARCKEVLSCYYPELLAYHQTQGTA